MANRFAAWMGFGAAALAACQAPHLDVPVPGRAMDAPAQARSITGSLRDRAGVPVAGAAVTVLAFQPAQIQPSVATDAAGRFRIEGLQDINVMLTVEAAGFYPEVVPVELQGLVADVALEPVLLVRRAPKRVRLWVAGDLMFGRRFQDADDDGLLGEPGDLLRPGHVADDALALMRFILPALRPADFRVANFESPASTHHDSRHPLKRYSFTTDPEALAALWRAGIEAVSLGNNHAYDYLEPGMQDTLDSMNHNHIGYFGAGMSLSEARSTRFDAERNGVPMSFQGFNEIQPTTFYPDPNMPWDTKYYYVAMDEPKKGGSLLLDRTNLQDFFARTPTDRLRVPVMHGGEEYGERPTSSMRDKFDMACRLGAKLVAAHHSHTVYGVATRGDVEDPCLVFLSLGNFIFDQDVFETFNSMMALVTVDELAPGQHRIEDVRMIPFHQEQYVPSLIAGPQAERLGRHVGHLSTALVDRPEDDLVPAVVFPAPGGIAVAVRPSDYETETARVGFGALIKNGVSETFALRQPSDHPAEFITGFDAPAGTQLKLARDLLIYGDFEDHDVDGGRFENENWWQTETRYPSPQAAWSGRTGFVLFRQTGKKEDINTNLRNRMTFADGDELTLRCRFRGDGAGKSWVAVKYDKRDSQTFVGEETVYQHAGGDFDWMTWEVPFHPPARAGHLALSIWMEPPKPLGGSLSVDDCQVLRWERTVLAGEPIPAPHNFAYARVIAPDAPDGPLAFTFTRTTYRRRGAK